MKNWVTLLIQTVRLWLENNKVFFETIVAASLTIMSIVVAFSANSIVSRQNALMEYELQNQMQERKPLFSCSYHIETNSSSHDFERFVVSNSGGKIKDVEIDICDYIAVLRYMKETNTPSLCLIPHTEYPGRFEFDVATQSFAATNYRPCVLRNAIFGITCDEKSCDMTGRICTVISIRYSDSADQKHSEFYFVYRNALWLLKSIDFSSSIYDLCKTSYPDLMVDINEAIIFFDSELFQKFLISENTSWNSINLNENYGLISFFSLY